jgi:hypothetical protein
VAPPQGSDLPPDSGPAARAGRAGVAEGPSEADREPDFALLRLRAALAARCTSGSRLLDRSSSPREAIGSDLPPDSGPAARAGRAGVAEGPSEADRGDGPGLPGDFALLRLRAALAARCTSGSRLLDRSSSPREAIASPDSGPAARAGRAGVAEGPSEADRGDGPGLPGHRLAALARRTGRPLHLGIAAVGQVLVSPGSDRLGLAAATARI